MEALWIAVSIIALVALVAAFLLVRTRGKPGARPSNLAMAGMTMVILGIIFGDDRAVGYSFIGIGVVLAVIDVIVSRRNA